MGDQSFASNTESIVQEVEEAKPVVKKCCKAAAKEAEEKPAINLQDKVVFEFKVTGLKCAGCSGKLERTMKSEFDDKGMTDVAIALLTHKMLTTF